MARPVSRSPGRPHAPPDGAPVVISFCPLCGTGMAFDARVNGRELTFGVSGLLYNSDVLLYDRQTNSLWSQLLAQAISGPLKGSRLAMLPLTQTTWADWRRLHPGTVVLSANTGSAPEAHAAPVEKKLADRAFEAAACIGCGACVAACPNASGMLFTGAKVTHLNTLPQGQPERWTRVQAMVAQHDGEGFGGCTNIGECSAACPKDIPLDVISTLNEEFRQSLMH